jgi:hypothetical protein
MMFIIAGLMASTAINTFAQEQVKFTISADLFSKYIWRGQNINDDTVLQPAFGATYHGLTASIWSNLDLTNDSQAAPDNAWEFSEFDYSLDYSFSLPDVNWLSFSAGMIYYRFPNTPYNPTTELYGGVSLCSIPLSPSIKLFRDVDQIEGSYVQFGLGHTFEKIAQWNQKCYCGLQFGANVGWADSEYNDGYFGVNKSGFNDMTLSSGFCVQLYDWMIKPSLNYSTMLDSEVRSDRTNNDNIWFGVGATAYF